MSSAWRSYLVCFVLLRLQTRVLHSTAPRSRNSAAHASAPSLLLSFTWLGLQVLHGGLFSPPLIQLRPPCLLPQHSRFLFTALVPSEVTHLSGYLCSICLCPRPRALRRKNIIFIFFNLISLILSAYTLFESMLVEEGRKSERRMKGWREGGTVGMKLVPDYCLEQIPHITRS